MDLPQAGAQVEDFLVLLLGLCLRPSVRASSGTMGIKIALRVPDALRRVLALWTPRKIPLLRKF